MSLPEITLAVLWIGLTAYVLFGGADFGGGVQPPQGRQQEDCSDRQGDQAGRQDVSSRTGCAPGWARCRS
ncbi:hypothetical protein [Streptomyces sp. NPDC052015]|uniref:hypothetical protein n=1 Tax=Streptomyces sp. NPDC052015 TaxID=3154755 RepID=UPI003434D96C